MPVCKAALVGSDFYRLLLGLLSGRGPGQPSRARSEQPVLHTMGTNTFPPPAPARVFLRQTQSLRCCPSQAHSYPRSYLTEMFCFTKNPVMQCPDIACAAPTALFHHGGEGRSSGQRRLQHGHPCTAPAAKRPTEGL